MTKPLDIEDALRPRSLTTAAREMRAIADKIDEAGRSWGNALRIGKATAEALAWNSNDPARAAKAAAWGLAWKLAAELHASDEAASIVRYGAACLDELADDAKAGRIEAMRMRLDDRT